MLTLLLTARGDGCSDYLLPHFKHEVIRLDMDFLHHEGFCWLREGFHIGSREVSWDLVTAVYWRKPANPIVHGLPQLEGFELRQRLHLFRAMSAYATSRGVWQLVDPLHEYKFPKPLQLLEAAHHFRVPGWEILVGRTSSLNRPVVSKAFAPVPVKGDRTLTTSLIAEPERLDPQYTWFLQSGVDAPFDATVIHCLGGLWGYALPRPKNGEWIDWRLTMSNHLQNAWTRIEIPDHVSESIRKFMRCLGLSYGRLDFLIDAANQWWFLEVNPNGEFGWLDPSNEAGVYSTIAAAAESNNAVESR